MQTSAAHNPMRWVTASIGRVRPMRPAALPWVTGPTAQGPPGPQLRRDGNGGTGGMRRMGTVAVAADGSGASLGGSTEKLGPKVCILGGGFGGLYTAVRLESLQWPVGTKPQVTVVDQGSAFVFKPLLYDYLIGEVSADDVAPPFSRLLAPYPVRFVQGEVSGVALDRATSDGGSVSGGKVLLTDGSQVDYDWLVLALGTKSNIELCPGAKEHALPFVDFEDAKRCRAALEAAEGRAGRTRVVVVGAQYSGVELAAALAERLGGSGDVEIITPTNEVLAGQPGAQAEAARAFLTSRGVSVTTGAKVKSVKAAKEEGRKVLHVEPSSGGPPADVVADVVLWTAGQVPATKRAEPGSSSEAFPFPVNERGMATTDPTLKVVRHSNVFALGDIAGAYETAADATPVGAPMFPATAQVAFQQADYVAWNLWAGINGRTMLPFRYQHLGNMMSLGRDDAAVALNLPLPTELKEGIARSPLGPLLDAVGVKVGGAAATGQGILLDGPLGVFARRAAYWYRQPTDEQRLRVGQAWVQQALDNARKAAGSASTPK